MTLILAQAMKENADTGCPKGRITSLENNEHWFSKTTKYFPAGLAPFVDFILSPVQETSFAFFRGVEFEIRPNRDYDFVFVAGAAHNFGSGGSLAAMDLLRVIRTTDRTISAIIDNTWVDVYFYQWLFGSRNIRYDYARRLCFVGPVAGGEFSPITKNTTFQTGLKLWGQSRLKLRPVTTETAGTPFEKALSMPKQLMEAGVDQSITPTR